MASSDDTIYALATSPGRAGVAVVRISGARSAEVLTILGGELPGPRSMRLCRLRDADGMLLDEALVLGFAEGASFTGDAVVELHLHGSMAVVRAVLSAIERTGLARPAEPGEFTRRAFLAGRLDLSQVQGLGHLIDAETEAQRRQAMRFLSGEMARKVEDWRRDLIRAMALLEATIDFADEDVPVDVHPEVRALVAETLRSIHGEIAGATAATRIRDGFEVALIGAPNVGKSSLINRLTKSDAALVSEVAGTTRDVIAVRMDLRGILVTFLDMAGIRDTTDVVEGLGVERALLRAEKADMRIFLYEGCKPDAWPLPSREGDCFVRTKIDLSPVENDGVSSVTGHGVDALLSEIGERLRDRASSASLVASDRDLSLMQSVQGELAMILERMTLDGPELLSAAIRNVATSMRAIIGGVGIEAVLDEVFSSFCIGK